MKITAVILFGLFGFIELLVRLCLFWIAFIMYIDDPGGFAAFFEPVAWSYLKDFLGANK